MGACAQLGCWAMSGFKPDEAGSIVNVLAFLAGVLEGRSGGAIQTVSPTDGNGENGTFADILNKTAAGDGDAVNGPQLFAGDGALSALGVGETDIPAEQASGTVLSFRPNGADVSLDQDQSAANGPIPLLLSLRDGLEAGDVTLDDLERAFEQLKDVQPAGEHSNPAANPVADGDPTFVPGFFEPASEKLGLAPTAGLQNEGQVGLISADGEAPTGVIPIGNTQIFDGDGTVRPRPPEGNPTFFGPETARLEGTVPGHDTDFVVTPSEGAPPASTGGPVPVNGDQDTILPGPPDQHVLDSANPSSGTAGPTISSTDGDVNPVPSAVGEQETLPAGPGTARSPVVPPLDGDTAGQGSPRPENPSAVPSSDGAGRTLTTDTEFPEATRPVPDRSGVKPPLGASEQTIGTTLKAANEVGEPNVLDAAKNPVALEQTTAARSQEPARQPPAWIDAIIDAADRAGASAEDLAIRGSAVKPELVLPVQKSGATGLQDGNPLSETQSRSAEPFGRSLFAEESLKHSETWQNGNPVSSVPGGPQQMAKPDAHLTGAQSSAIKLEIADAASPILPAEMEGLLPEPDDALLLQTSGRTDSQLNAVKPVMAAQSGSQTTVTMDAVGLHIARMAQQKESRFEIRLHPSELGRIDVRLDINEQGEVKAHLIVERRETLDMLQRDSRELQRALTEAGLSADQNSLNFSMKHQNGEGFADGSGGRDSVGSLAQKDDTESDGITEAAARRAYVQSSDGALDISI